jgi:hypothetical protein
MNALKISAFMAFLLVIAVFMIAINLVRGERV